MNKKGGKDWSKSCPSLHSFKISIGKAVEKHLHSSLSWIILELRLFICAFLLLAVSTLLTLGKKSKLSTMTILRHWKMLCKLLVGWNTAISNKHHKSNGENKY